MRGCNATRLNWTRAKYCALSGACALYSGGVPWSQIGLRLFDGSTSDQFPVNPWLGRAMCTIGMHSLVYLRAYGYNEAQDLFCYANWYEFGSCELMKSVPKAIVYRQLHHTYVCVPPSHIRVDLSLDHSVCVMI